MAIKVLHEGASAAHSVELLEEARIMASVRHENCIRIAAVCMSATLQLVTPLMACGSLLAYIRRERENVGSKSLVSWSLQIAAVCDGVT